MDEYGMLIPLNEIKVEIKEEIVEQNIIEEVIVKEEPQEWTEIDINVEVKQEQDAYEPVPAQITETPQKAQAPKRKRVIPKEKRSLECKLCGKTFKLRIALDVHRKTHKRTPQEKYQCDVCGYSHLFLCRIRSHMTKHLKHKVYFCKYCEQQYSTRKNLNLHLKTHKDLKNATKLKLMVPNTSNCDVKIKVDTVKTEHSDKKFLICPECGKLCPNLSSLKRHLISHQNFKIFECDLCGRGFKRREHIKQHMNVHLDIRPHSCELCWKSFKSRGELTKHLVIHSATKPHHCPICDKSFRTKAEVRLHSVVHTDDRPFGCENCPKFFKTKGELRKHKKVHSLDKPECSLCGRKFRDEKSLLKHGEWHQKRPVYENFPAVQMGNQQVFECDICYKSFALKVRLRRHKDSVHRTDRPFLCDICKKGYKTKDEIKKHIVIHLDSRNYKCEICQFSFKRSHDLVRHNKLHAQGRINIGALFGKTKLSYKLQKLV